MRWIRWASALLAVCAVTCSATAAEHTRGPGSTCTGCEKYDCLAAPACGMPFYGWKPGCCQCQPTACDNAWATYCDEKARWRAFWYRVGTGAYSHHRSVYCVPGKATPAMQPAGTRIEAVPDEIGAPVRLNQPAPAPPPPPPLPPRQTTSRWRIPWPR